MSANSALPGDAEPRPAPATGADTGRSLELLLARLHLRTGSLGLARAELEALAGRGELDDDGLVDLAEARWRTGDLPGAGDAASAYVGANGRDPIGLLILAEATVAAGRPGEARSTVGRVLEAIHGSVDPLFAGMPRSSIWPADRAIADAERAAVSPGESAAGPGRPPDRAPDPAAELEDGRAALDSGRVEVAALHFLVALRLAPALAPRVLELLAASRGGIGPAIEIVRGDAHRLLGQESAARAAYGAAAVAIHEAGQARRRARPS